MQYKIFIISIYFFCISTIIQASTAELIIVPKNDSLISIKNIIETSTIDKNAIVVAFDFDQTLKDVKKEGIKTFVSIRGGEQTKHMLDFLTSHNIPWFIISAAGTSKSALGTIAFDVKKLELPVPKRLNNECEKKNFMNGEIIKGSGEFEKYTFGVCNNIVNAAYEGDNLSYAKDIALQFAIEKYDIPYPKLIIFADDHPGNVLVLYNYYMTGPGKNKNVHFIGIVYEPVVEEPGYEEGIKPVREIQEAAVKDSLVTLSTTLQQLQQNLSSK